MRDSAPARARHRPDAPVSVSRALPAFIVAATGVVFVLDTVTPAEFAVSVLYVGVVLLAARVLQPRGILLVSVGCAVLTLVSFALSRQEAAPTAAIAKPDGMGMGLAICRSIVAAHGGRLWASADAPHGTVFQPTLPAAARP